MTGGAALLVRRDRDDAPDLRERRGQALDAFGEDSVVVGDQDSRRRFRHGAGSSARGITNMRMMYARIPGKAAEMSETMTYRTRMRVGSISRYSAMPPQTPAIILWRRERVRRRGGGGAAAGPAGGGALMPRGP